MVFEKRWNPLKNAERRQIFNGVYRFRSARVAKMGCKNPAFQGNVKCVFQFRFAKKFDTKSMKRIELMLTQIPKTIVNKQETFPHIHTHIQCELYSLDLHLEVFQLNVHLSWDWTLVWSLKISSFSNFSTSEIWI